MNRRNFLRGALRAAAALTLSKLAVGSASRDSDIAFLANKMTKGARKLPLMAKENMLPMLPCSMGRGSLVILDNFGMSIYLDDIESLAKDAQAICDAIKPAIDALAELEEFEAPKIGRVWYVGPGGDDANDGLTPESCLLSFEEGMKRAGREDEVNAIADFVL